MLVLFVRMSTKIKKLTAYAFRVLLFVLLHLFNPTRAPSPRNVPPHLLIPTPTTTTRIRDAIGDLESAVKPSNQKRHRRRSIRSPTIMTTTVMLSMNGKIFGIAIWSQMDGIVSVTIYMIPTVMDGLGSHPIAKTLSEKQKKIETILPPRNRSNNGAVLTITKPRPPVKSKKRYKNKNKNNHRNKNHQAHKECPLWSTMALYHQLPSRQERDHKILDYRNFLRRTKTIHTAGKSCGRSSKNLGGIIDLERVLSAFCISAQGKKSKAANSVLTTSTVKSMLLPTKRKRIL
mmetsp:Transcript_6440/g.9290  ORF Transcript_6440/g.9290 Transcript_6440/m.9290 type:complete len:289 (+) Transcript_6440:235-1101(+)